jgi:HAD superfamily phosphoserine phosphatase-like hydrolase
MNVYDFDGTIYDGDSTVDFWGFSLKRHPKAMLHLFPTIGALALYAARFIDKTAFKQRFYGFLKAIPDIEGEVCDFWDKHEGKIKLWYLAQKKADDLIISASPYFLLKPICDKLGVRLIASMVDAHTGVYDGVNCHGEEKVRRFRGEHPPTESDAIEAFYSDSHADDPMAKTAAKAYFVRGNNITPW